MDIIKKITLGIIFLCLSNLLLGQKDIPKTLHLKDGSFLLGSLVGKSNEVYIWQLTDGTQITLPVDQVRFIKEKNDDFIYLENGKFKRTKGYFASILAGGLFEGKKNEGSATEHAPSASLMVGYRLNPMTSIGFGIGYDVYHLPIIPLFLEVSGDLLKKSITPYYKFSLGYGFATPTKGQKENDSVTFDGGVLLHPSVGVKFYTHSNHAWLIDFGYRFHRFDQTFTWDQSPQRWTLQRTSFRIGIEF